MIKGLIYALSACVIWGLIFVIPHSLTDFSALELTLGRYFSYGVFSAVLLLRRGAWHIRRFPLKAWSVALIFALFANVLYYAGVVVGLRYVSAPITVLIMGMCPILAAFYGNWHAKEVAFRKLVFPSICIVGGLVLVNFSEIDWSFQIRSFKEYIIGLLCAIGSVSSWGWYAVQNARFLKMHSHLPRSDWSTVIGVASLFWVLLFGAIIQLSPWPSLDLSKFAHLSPEIIHFFVGILILGMVCSWLGCYLWNQASSYLPLSLMGSLIIFETLFSLIFVFLVERRLPSPQEFLGIASMLIGILIAIRAISRNAKVA